MVLKHRVLTEGKSLAKAIRESKPDLDANAEVRRARAEAKSDLNNSAWRSLGISTSRGLTSSGHCPAELKFGPTLSCHRWPDASRALLRSWMEVGRTCGLG